jgi:hypothetical protein
MSAFLVAACGGGSSGGDTDALNGAAPPAPSATGRTGTPPDLSNAGTIVVTATFAGEVPEGPIIDMRSDPSCGRLQSSERRRARPVTVNDDGTLRSVLVYVREGLEGMTFPAAVPADPVFGFDLEGIFAAEDCVFRPHVLAMRTGQAMTVRNSDETHHRATAKPANGPALRADQPMAGMEMQHSFANPEVGIPVRCEMHSWMSAFIHVFDHPYFTVLGEDNRRFELDPLPPGDYVLEAWHDTLGTQELRVTVTPSSVTEVNFAFGE